MKKSLVTFAAAFAGGIIALAAYHFVVNPDQGIVCTRESLSENIAIIKSGAYKKTYTPLNAVQEKNPFNLRKVAFTKGFRSVELLALLFFLVKGALCSGDSGENSQKHCGYQKKNYGHRCPKRPIIC